MRLFNKVTLTIYSLFFLIFALIIMTISLKLVPVNMFVLYLEKIYGKWEVSLIGLLLLMISVVTLHSSTKRNRSYKSIISDDGQGEVRISEIALKNIIINSVKSIVGVRDVNVIIKTMGYGINLVITANVTPDRNIPETGKDIGKLVKENIEETTGIKVQKTKIIIKDITTSKT